MPERGIRLRLQDIIEAIDRIDAFLVGRSFETFAADEMCVHAVLHNLQIIGEAAKVIPKEITSNWSSIPWSDIRGMRNVLVHGYFGIDLGIIWTTANVRLAELRSAAMAMLDEVEGA